MDPSRISALYAGLRSPSAAEQQAAAAELAVAQESPAAAEQCVKLVAGGAASTEVAFFCAQVWHRTLRRREWRLLPEDARTAAAAFVSAAAFRTDLEEFVAAKLLDVVAAVAMEDWPERWPGFLGWAMEAVVAGDPYRRRCGCRVLRSVMEECVDERSARGPHVRQLLSASGIAVLRALCGAATSSDDATGRAQCSALWAMVAAVECLPPHVLWDAESGVAQLLASVADGGAAGACLHSPIHAPVIALCTELVDQRAAADQRLHSAAMAAHCIVGFMHSAAAQGSGAAASALGSAAAVLLQHHCQRLDDGAFPQVCGHSPSLRTVLPALGAWTARAAGDEAEAAAALDGIIDAWFRVSEYVDMLADQGRGSAAGGASAQRLAQLREPLLSFVQLSLPLGGGGSLLGAVQADDDDDAWYDGSLGRLVLSVSNVAAAFPEDVCLGEGGGPLARALACAVAGVPETMTECDGVLQMYSALAPSLASFAREPARLPAVAAVTGELLSLLPALLQRDGGGSRLSGRAFGLLCALSSVVRKLVREQRFDAAAFPAVLSVCAAQLPSSPCCKEAGTCLARYSALFPDALSGCPQYPHLVAAVAAACGLPNSGKHLSGFVAAVLMLGSDGSGVVRALTQPPRAASVACLAEAVCAVGESSSGQRRSDAFGAAAPEAVGLLQHIAGVGEPVLDVCKGLLRHWPALADRAGLAAAVLQALHTADALPVASVADVLALVCKPPKSPHAAAVCAPALRLWQRARDAWDAAAVMGLVHTVIDVHWELFWQDGGQAAYAQASSPVAAAWPDLVVCALAPVLADGEVSQDPAALHTALRWALTCDRDRGLFVRAMSEPQRRDVALRLLRLQCRAVAVHSDLTCEALWRLAGGDALWRPDTVVAAADAMASALPLQPDQAAAFAELRHAVATPMPKAGLEAALRALSRRVTSDV